MNRRFFIKSGGIALASIGVSLSAPSFLQRAVLAQARERITGGRRKTLITIFQRGAVDGLNMVVPHGEHAYYDVRPSIAIPRPKTGDAESAIDLDGFFGLHPSLAPFKPLWDSKRLAIVEAAGSPDNTRSHFDAQDYMESATPGVKSTQDGWLNRYLQVSSEERNPLRGVALARTMPRSLEGLAPALAIGSVDEFGVRGAAAAFQDQYESSSDPLLSSAGNDAFAAMKTLRQAAGMPYRPAAGA